MVNRVVSYMKFWASILSWLRLSAESRSRFSIREPEPMSPSVSYHGTKNKKRKEQNKHEKSAKGKVWH